MKIYNRVGQTKIILSGMTGLLTMHHTTSQLITVGGSLDHKQIIKTIANQYKLDTKHDSGYIKIKIEGYQLVEVMKLIGDYENSHN